MDGSGAVCAISALTNIADTCSAMRTQLDSVGGGTGSMTALSSRVKAGVESEASEEGEANMGSHTESCGKGCTEIVYDDDLVSVVGCVWCGVQ